MLGPLATNMAANLAVAPIINGYAEPQASRGLPAQFAYGGGAVGVVPVPGVLNVLDTTSSAAVLYPPVTSGGKSAPMEVHLSNEGKQMYQAAVGGAPIKNFALEPGAAGVQTAVPVGGADPSQPCVGCQGGASMPVYGQLIAAPTAGSVGAIGPGGQQIQQIPGMVSDPSNTDLPDLSKISCKDFKRKAATGSALVGAGIGAAVGYAAAGKPLHGAIVGAALFAAYIYNLPCAPEMLP